MDAGRGRLGQIANKRGATQIGFVLLLETQGLDDALIQPYSGHASRASLEIYSRLSLADAQDSYDQAISRFPV